MLLAAVNILLAKETNLGTTGIDRTGSTEVSHVIQKAIDDCHAAGGGRVVLPAGIYLCGTVIMKDNVELHLEQGASILGSTNPSYLPHQETTPYRSLKDEIGWYSIFYAAGAKHIAITGAGTIDGQGANQVPRVEGGGDRDGRPRNILFISCSDVRVTGITLRNSGMWNVHLLDCEDVLVNDIKVYNHSNRNNDGIDIDGSRRVLLTNSIFDSGDDAICLKSTGPSPCEDVVISNCVVSSFCNGIKMGTESTGGFRNINISNCIIKPSVHPDKPDPTRNPSAIGITGLSLEIVDGGAMEGISVNNLTIEGTNCPIYVRLGGRNRKHRDDAPEPATGSMKNITISNVTAYNSGNFACSVTGIPGHKVENVRLNNIHIIQQGGLEEGDYLKSLNDVAEDIKGYPQPTVWRNLPVCGLFIRHVDGLSVTNFSINTLEPDPRPLFMAHDVNNLVIKGVYAGDNVDIAIPFFKKEVTDYQVEY